MSSSAVAQPPVHEHVMHSARREHTRSERTPPAESYRPRAERVRRHRLCPGVHVSFDMPDSTTRGVKPTLSEGRQEMRRRILVVLTASVDVQRGRRAGLAIHERMGRESDRVVSLAMERGANVKMVDEQRKIQSKRIGPRRFLRPYIVRNACRRNRKTATAGLLLTRRSNTIAVNARNTIRFPRLFAKLYCQTSNFRIFCSFVIFGAFKQHTSRARRTAVQ